MRNSYIFIILFLILSTNIFSQGFYDLDAIQTIEITFAESNWDALLDAEYAGDGDYIMAQSVTINGVEFDSVGVKYKGNSSYNARQVKNPWHIELDTYKDHDYDGYTDIKLANGANDPSFLRDVLGFHIIRKYMDAPLSNYANLYVNGTLIGLYTNTESISKKFVKSRFGSKNNAFFDCSPPDGANPQGGDYPNLVYLGQDSTAYYDAYEMKSDIGWQELINFCDTLSNHISDIEKIIDVDRALWMLAFDNAIVNLDSYIGIFSQNYYLYKSDYQQFLPIVWDLNESFGVFSQTGSSSLRTTAEKQQMSHLLHSSDSNFPLVKQLLSIPMYKRMYLAHYKTLLLENFDNNDYYDAALTLQTLIDASVQADVNKFFTYNDFKDNLSSDIRSGFGPQSTTTPGITSLMDGRTSYLLALSDFTQTQPAISTIALSNDPPAINETITISAFVADAHTVYLGYRNESIAPFTRVQMYDDGEHGDGAANDGTYGTDLEINNSELQYYIYAENDNAGTFSPERAQCEYYTITAAASGSAAGELVVNEFMASNESTATDQDGEYDDWIELYNNTDSDISLSGYFLSDDSDELSLWAFPDTTISAHGYLIIWADKDEEQQGLHADLKLSGSGETLYLSNSDTTIVDHVSFGEQTDDISTGRYPNGTGDFMEMSPSFGTENGDGTAVPVELYGFSAVRHDNAVVLRWSTASETNNLHFEIERSADKKSFETIATVAGNGTVASLSDYEFRDEEALNGVNYYRLKQVDYDGTSSYSSIISVNSYTPENYALGQNYPNPFNPSTTIQCVLPVSNHVSLKIYNSNGQFVSTLVDEQLLQGTYEFQWQAANMSSGIYFYTLSSGEFSQTKRMILLN